MFFIVVFIFCCITQAFKSRKQKMDASADPVKRILYVRELAKCVINALKEMQADATAEQERIETWEERAHACIRERASKMSAQVREHTDTQTRLFEQLAEKLDESLEVLEEKISSAHKSEHKSEHERRSDLFRSLIASCTAFPYISPGLKCFGLDDLDARIAPFPPLWLRFVNEVDLLKQIKKTSWATQFIYERQDPATLTQMPQFYVVGEQEPFVRLRDRESTLDLVYALELQHKLDAESLKWIANASRVRYRVSVLPGEVAKVAKSADASAETETGTGTGTGTGTSTGKGTGTGSDTKTDTDIDEDDILLRVGLGPDAAQTQLLIGPNDDWKDCNVKFDDNVSVLYFALRAPRFIKPSQTSISLLAYICFPGVQLEVNVKF